MKQLVLTLVAAAMACSINVNAQTRVRNVYTETASLNAQQMQQTDQPVRLNRYLFAGYNTICLPMSVSADQLGDLRIERLSAIRQQGATLCLYFTECTTEGLEAGVPYLVFSPTARYLRVSNTESNGFADEPATIRLSDNEGNQVSFGSSWERRVRQGVYGIPAKQNVEVLESILISTTEEQSFLPTRCGISWERQSATANELAIVHATAAEVTAISNARVEKIGNDNIYDLNGRRVSDPANGLNIQGGKKVVC